MTPAPSYRYRAFGLVFESDLELPTLLPVSHEDDASADVQISTMRDPELWPAGAPEDPGPWMRGQFPEGFVFEARPHLITMWAPAVYDDDLVRTYLLGYIVGVSLRLRGMLVLHAGCVARDGRAVAFVGRSGWGKSTLAAHFVQRGYDLLADDLTGIIVPTDGGSPVVYPGLAHIRLYPDTGEALLDGYAGLPRLNAHSAKRVGFAPPQEHAPRPLVKLYALEETYRDTVAIEPLAPAEAFAHLAAHTRAMHEFPPHALKRHLEQSSQLLRTVPVALLRRRRSLEALDEVVSLVEADAGLCAEATPSHRAA